MKTNKAKLIKLFKLVYDELGTTRDIAVKLGISESYVRSLKCGYVRPSHKLILKLERLTKGKIKFEDF